MNNWREIISKAPMNYETGKWEKPPSPYSGQGNSVANTMARRMKEANAQHKEKEMKDMQRLVEQQIESKLPQMAELGQTRIRIPRAKIESYNINIGDSGEDYETPANEFMQNLKSLLGAGMNVGIDGKDVIIDTGSGNLATRGGKTLNPETGEPMGRMQAMGQRAKDAVGRTSMGAKMGMKRFGRTQKAEEEHLEVVSDAILKAKSILQEAEHLGTVEMKEPVTGEEVNRKKPKKNPTEEKFDNPQIDGYGHVGSKHYIGKELTERYNGIKEQLATVDDQIAKAYVDGAASSRQELINKRIRIENSLDDVSKSILTKTVLDSMYVLETIVKATATHTPAFVDTIQKTMAQLENLMEQFNAGEMDKDEYERRYKKIKNSLHAEASSPGGHDSGHNKPIVAKSDLVRKDLKMLDELMQRFKAGEITEDEMHAEYNSRVRESLLDEASSPGGHDSIDEEDEDDLL